MFDSGVELSLLSCERVGMMMVVVVLDSWCGRSGNMVASSSAAVLISV